MNVDALETFDDVVRDAGGFELASKVAELVRSFAPGDESDSRQFSGVEMVANPRVACDGGDVVRGPVVVLRERLVPRPPVRLALEIFASPRSLYHLKPT